MEAKNLVRVEINKSMGNPTCPPAHLHEICILDGGNADDEKCQCVRSHCEHECGRTHCTAASTRSFLLRALIASFMQGAAKRVPGQFTGLTKYARQPHNTV
eukprot:scaffold42949_cov15-Tisochrysis_lutea.AAC.1